jgi:hypothetical protein
VDRDGPLRNLGLVVAGVPLTFLVDHAAVPVLTIGRDLGVCIHPSDGDRGFESISLQRGVMCEPGCTDAGRYPPICVP